MFDSDIQKAILSKEPPYKEFTKRISKLKKKLEERIGVSMYHNIDMNYSSSQQISYFVNIAGEISEDKGETETPLRVSLFISSKGPYVCPVIFNRKGRNIFSPMDFDEEYSELFRCMWSAIKIILEEDGIFEIERNLLRQNVPGQKTELDDVPANLFEVLFAEVM